MGALNFDTVYSSDFGEVSEFPAGQVLFKEGDPGGSLYFIKTGVVEIFQLRGQREIALAEVSDGEVIGTLSFLNKENRLATARTKSFVQAVVIDSSKVDQNIKDIPLWLKTVIKDFTLRIKNINSKYCELQMQLNSYRSKDLNQAKLAAQFSNALNYYAETINKKKYINLNECLAKIALILDCNLKDLRFVLDCFENAGIFKRVIDAPPIFNSDALDSIQLFADLINATTKFGKDYTNERTINAIYGICNVVKYLKLDKQETAVLNIDDLNGKYNHLVGMTITTSLAQNITSIPNIRARLKDSYSKIEFMPRFFSSFLSCCVAKNLLTESANKSNSRPMPGSGIRLPTV